MQKDDLLEAVLKAMERLMKLFAVERYVYLVLTAVSTILMLFVGYKLLSGSTPDKALLMAVCGGSGIIAAASMRTTWFFNKAFSLVAGVVSKEADDAGK
jgi:hypothetical protein